MFEARTAVSTWFEVKLVYCPELIKVAGCDSCGLIMRNFFFSFAVCWEVLVRGCPVCGRFYSLCDLNRSQPRLDLCGFTAFAVKKIES